MKTVLTAKKIQNPMMLQVGDKVSITAKDMQIGDSIKVTWGGNSQIGELVHENHKFITVQFKHYKECFLKVDIKNGIVEVEEQYKQHKKNKEV